MNSIYKVIWSKAKNCYVVASEIARSHTKSATGSEKIGGVTRRSLLASLMALSLLCGGLGVASASLEVLDQSGTAGTVTIYTKDEVDNALTAKGTAADVASNKEAITNLKNAVGDAGSGLTKEVADQKAAIAANTASITTNKDNITQLDTKKLDKDLANSTFATKDALNGLAATVNNKVDESVVETALDGKADKADTLAGYGIKDAYTKGDVDNKLNEKADAANVNTALAGKANVGDSYTKAEADGKFATSEALNTAKTDLEGKITSAKNELDGKITANTQKIGANETAITDLKDADVRLEGKINQNTNDITGLKDKDVELSGKIDNNKNLIDQNAANITQNKNDIVAIGGRLTTAEGNIQTNADAINALDTKVGTINNGNYLDGTKSVGENLNALDAQTKTNTDEIARVNQELVNTNNHFNTELGKTNTALNKEVQERVDADTKLTGRIDATDKRTAGIKRTDTGVEEDNQTVIEGKVHFDQNGNVSDVKGLSAETITTTGDAAIGGALGVTGATTLDGALTANGEATFKDKVTVEKDLTVNGKLNVGEIYLKNDKLESTGKKHDSATSITADGISNLAKVTEHGNTTESQFTHNEKGTFNHAKDGSTTDWKESTSNVTADGVANVAKDSKGNNNTFTQTSTDTKNILTDKDGNTSTTRQDGKGIYGYAKDKDGNKSYTKQEGNRIAESVIGKDGTETKSEMTSTDITNTAKDGTITNDAKDIVNNATGDMTNTVGGNLTTTVGGNEIHDVKGTKTETVEGKVTENFKGGQETNVTGNQTTNVSGTQTTTATDINRNASSSMVDKVDNAYGTNTETKEAGKTTTDVSIKGTGEKGQYIRGANESRDYLIKGTLKNSETKTAEVTSTEITDGTNAASTRQDAKNLAGSVTNGTETGISGIHANDDGSVSIDSAVAGGGMSSVINQKKDSIQSAVGDGTNSTVIHQDKDNVTIASSNGTVAIVGKDIVNNASESITNKAKTMDTTVTGKATESYGELDTTVTGQATENFNGGLNTKVTGAENHTVTGKQTNTVEGGQENIISGGQTNTITGGQVNNITGDQTTTITGNKKETVTENVTEDYKKNLTTTVGGNEIHDVKGTKTETVEGKVTENFKGGQETNVTGNQDIHVTGKQTNKIDGDQENTIGGNQTTTVTGDISNKAKNITNEASNSITDKVGDHTRVLDSDGITDTVGGSTFKQRIDKIMMESKNVSIKAEETLTNEAKVITNKASEVINNEAVNINNTATGIITSKASEIKNQADKLISNKVGENTWENMENGKITTFIKDGAKQNLTQSDAAGTTQSTVDGNKSTVTIQNADGLTDAVRDGAGNENGSVATATTSANTIKSGSKANTVISTADGTSFINSEAAAPVTGASGAGTAVNTTIKGNTITTGKVTMDYAEVMKDLGVRGNANITGKTTTGSLEVKGESKLTGDVTMESNATVKKDLTVEGNTNLKNTKVDGTLDVTQKANFGDSVSIAKDLSVGGNATIKGDVTASSYKVGDKTYISAVGINANDQKITNVADGSISEGSKDAVNGGQLYTVKNDFEGKVNKVGANAAAMANLHPMEFDPDSKWNIAAAIGNYGSETAAALGAFYRPNDDVMVNLSTAFGTGENMVGGGVSVRLGKGGNKLSREETNALKAQVADLTARMDALLSVLNPNMSKDFPDVPENHWAYEAVSRLAGNDIVQGYPDGEFHGERTMTRYEMAEIIYNALSRGAEAEKELVEEFKPELQAMAASEKATAEKAEG